MRGRVQYLLTNAYNHGFERGLILAPNDSPKDLVERAHEIRDRNLSLSVSGGSRISSDGYSDA